MNVTHILTEIEDDQRKDIDTKVEALHTHWTNLKNIVENRVDLVQLFAHILKLADSISNMFDYVERALEETPADEKLRQLDTIWNKIKPAYAQLKLDGARFIDEMSKVCVCVCLFGFTKKDYIILIHKQETVCWPN